jgi:DNA transposition AAA+ family ATPase
MTTSEKREIQYKLRIYIGSFSSQKRACNSIDGVSESTVITMLNQDQFGWDKISDAMWRTVASQVGGIVNFSKLVETQNFKTLRFYFDLAKEESATFAIVGNAGWGKTYTAKWYTAENRVNNVYYIECADYLNKKQFLNTLLMQIGKSGYGLQVGDLMLMLVRELRKQEKPLIIMDEIDKLTDPIIKFFITLYNELNGTCGFVWLSTDAIEKRFIKNLEKNTIGYQELFSRIGATFMNLKMPAQDEVQELCKVNGITDQNKVAVICNEIKDLKGDLRRFSRNHLKDRVSKRIRSKTNAA